MLEVFAYKKYKKHKLAKQLREANAKEALDSQDEEFIRRSIDKDGGSKAQQGAGSLFKRFGRKKSGEEVPPPTKEELDAVHEGDTDGTATPGTQEADLEAVLNSLNLAVEKKTAFSLSEETRALLKEFTQILKDIQAGGTHSYDDLTSFLHKSNANLNKMFESIPGFLKSLISTLPFPLAKKLDKKSAKDVTGDILKDLMKPGVVTGLLKNIMSVLRTRFPAFVGSNALLALGVFVLLFGVWYCYKRGREERIKMGKEESQEVLVEGTKQKQEDTADHGDRREDALPERVATPVLMHGGVPVVRNTIDPGLGGEENLGATPAALVNQGVAIEGDVPLQVQSEPIPAAAKKGRMSWLKGK